ncbi:MAG TPA: ABC transporter substrate-binding protein [Candidatus Limnocylindrales bacterium]|nr:ABC transporter substrate-binding protein [Candidatus Limnocylindrales bacterium]
MDRTRRPARLGAALVVTLLVAACSPAASSSPTDPATSEVPTTGPTLAPTSAAGGGSLSMAVEGDLQTLDPAICYDTNCGPVMRMLFDQLLEYAPNSAELIPGLAEAMPEVSADGTTYTFTLREGVTFTRQDGTPLREVTADDVVWSLNRILDPSLTPTPSPVGPAFFAQISGSAAVLDGTSTEASGLVAIDERTIEISIDAPNRAFLNVLAMPFGSILPKELAGSDTTAFSDAPIGSGAFYLESYTRGEKVVLQRNTAYWREGYPKVDTVEYRLVVDAGVQLQQVEAGDLDIMGNDIPAGEYTATVNDPTYEDQIIRTAQVATNFLVIDTSGPTEPLTNVKVRQAIAHAIDKDNLLLVNNGRGVKAGCIYPPQFAVYDAACDPYPYDLDMARQLMKDAGYEAGFSTKLYTDTQELSKSVSESMIQDLAAINITIELVQQDFDVLIGTITTPHTAPLVYIGWYQDFPDPSDFYDPIMSCAANVPGGASFGWYCNEDADALANEARGEADEATRIDLYRQLQDLVMADVPSVPLFNPEQVSLVSDRVVGDPFHPGYFVDLTEIDVTE